MEDNSAKILSNEEIIDELTKNLEETCVKMDDNKSENENKEVLDEEEDEEEEKESKIDVDLDDIDEEELKSRDLGLSESEKEILKDKAAKLKEEGNSLFKEGNYEEATKTYTLALRTLPLEYTSERAILYANRAAAKAKFINEKEVAVMDCTKAIELNPNYTKVYIRRAHLYEEMDKLDEALEDYKQIVTLDPSNQEANIAIRRLPPMIEERNEKLKTEMMGKLKDLGNMILRPFGLSTNNFELQKDANSGGYSVKFNQNPT